MVAPADLLYTLYHTGFYLASANYCATKYKTIAEAIDKVYSVDVHYTILRFGERIMVLETRSYRMRDLIKLSGVSRQTIHFYLREGLLPPPVRASKNMAYYDESTVDDIRLIKELQEKRYLPLTVIKEILKGKRGGSDYLEEDHLALYEYLFGHSKNGSEYRQFDESSFLAESGITKNELTELIDIGIIAGAVGNGSHLFDEFDLDAAKGIKELLNMGVRLQDVKLYGSFLQLARQEIELVHERIIRRKQKERHQPLMDIYSGLENVKRLLTAKAYREYIMTHSHEENAGRDTPGND